jgi:cell wall-associated NlpC family hydrolase
MGRWSIQLVAVLALAPLVGCAGHVLPPDPAPAVVIVPPPPPHQAVVDTARSMLGVPYRFGGSTPKGFDCSGLVVYSFKQAGRPGLPHSARVLERVAHPVSLRELQPGDLLFFELRKRPHVGIYTGDRHFVHAPSRGKRVERVSFDDRYWGPRIRKAGRIQITGTNIAMSS